MSDSGRRGRDRGAEHDGDELEHEGTDDDHDVACEPSVVVPEAPIAILLPLSAGAIGAVVLFARRRVGPRLAR